MYLMRTIKMEHVCWADNCIIDMYWAINYVKQKWSNRPYKRLIWGHGWLCYSRSRGFPGAALGKSARCRPGSFPSQVGTWLPAVFALQSYWRLIWNKLFPSPSQSGPGGIQSLSWSLPFDKGEHPLVPCSMPQGRAFQMPWSRPHQEWSPSVNSHLCSSLPISMALTWLLTYSFCLLFAASDNWYNFSSILLWIQSYSLSVNFWSL